MESDAPPSPSHCNKDAVPGGNRCVEHPHIRPLTPQDERNIARQPLLNIDSLAIPSPYILDKSIDLDYEQSYVWEERGEVLGFIQVYSTADREKIHIYRQVTSPFGRGKGIGTALVNYLASSVAPHARIYLYVWDKLLSSMDFFKGKGFAIVGHVVYRKMSFHLMEATAAVLCRTTAVVDRPEATIVEELSRVRHDVRKSLRVLSDMAAMLSVDNFARISEDITRESRVMLNILNMYEDTVHLSHKVSLKELLFERVIPYIEAVDNSCEVRFNCTSRIDSVNGSYVSVSRALINIVANAMDAIRESGRRGLLEFNLQQQDDDVTLTISDNGVGIAAERLLTGPDNVPLFVGHTTKGSHEGEGIGTRQVYTTFGSDNISVASEAGKSTSWTISFRRSTTRTSLLLTELGSRYIRFIKSSQYIVLNTASSRNEIAAFIWQLRQMELFSYDLICYFSRYNNVRDIFQNILLYRFGGRSFAHLKNELRRCRIEHPAITSWLLGITSRISRNENWLRENIPFQEFKDVLFQSYCQTLDRTMIFTLDPESGSFFTTDRKLAEHLDFVPYLGRPRDNLLRGELVGDVRNPGSPVYLGVWSVRDRSDLLDKLALIRQGVQQLLEMGLHREKRISFYTTTYTAGDWEIDTFKTTTLGEMAGLPEYELSRFIREADSAMGGIVLAG